MRVSVGLPTHRVGTDMVSGPAVTQMAAAAEAAGFDAVFVTEHPFPGDRWLASGGHHALDPFVALSFAAAGTTRLRLHTNLVVLAYRNPFLAAKAVASLDVLSGGRVILGVGTGYLETEFSALGVAFDERNHLTDEALDAMKQAWRDTGVVRAGLHFEATGNTMLPRPVQRPHPPIWVGGNSRRAIRRAVELADGWMPMPNPARGASRRHTPPMESLDDLAQGLAYARAHMDTTGRSRPLEVVYMPAGADMLSPGGPVVERVVDHAGEMAEAGVTYMAMMLPAESCAEWCERATTFGRDALPAIGAIPAARARESSG